MCCGSGGGDKVGARWGHGGDKGAARWQGGWKTGAGGWVAGGWRSTCDVSCVHLRRFMRPPATRGG